MQAQDRDQEEEEGDFIYPGRILGMLYISRLKTEIVRRRKENLSTRITWDVGRI